MGMMFNEPLLTGHRDEVLRAIRHVRNRWRIRVALRGMSVFAAAVLGTFLASLLRSRAVQVQPGRDRRVSHRHLPRACSGSGGGCSSVRSHVP